MKFLLITFFVFVHIISGYSQGSVYVEMKFKNFEEFQDLNYYRVNCNILKPVSHFSFGYNNEIYNNKGEFSFTGKIDYPTLIQISWYKQAIYLPVFPNDTIKLTIDVSTEEKKLEDILKFHSKSTFKTDSLIFELNKINQECKNEDAGINFIKDQINNASTIEQSFFATQYLSYLNQNKVSIKDQKLRFLAFWQIMSTYPKALNYNANLKSTLENEFNDFKGMSGLHHDSIIIHDDKFKNFTELIERIKKDNAGYTVFLDLWGTWCPGCLLDIKHKKELGLDEIFKKYNVNTVYLCRTSPQKEFDYYVNKLDMKGNHYFLTKELAKDAELNYNAIGYPYYMLIDKNGNLIHENVPRPILYQDEKRSLNTELIELIKEMDK